MKKLNGFNSRLAAGLVLLFTIFIISGSCQKNNDYGGSGGNGGGSKGPNDVYIQNMAFSPGTITVYVGTTVKWTNMDGVTHTVTSDDNSFNSGNIPGNGTYSYTFNTAGTYSYHCAIHPGMTGEVKVNTVSGY